MPSPGLVKTQSMKLARGSQKLLIPHGCETFFFPHKCFPASKWHDRIVASNFRTDLISAQPTPTPPSHRPSRTASRTSPLTKKQTHSTKKTKKTNNNEKTQPTVRTEIDTRWSHITRFNQCVLKAAGSIIRWELQSPDEKFPFDHAIWRLNFHLSYFRRFKVGHTHVPMQRLKRFRFCNHHVDRLIMVPWEDMMRGGYATFNDFVAANRLSQTNLYTNLSWLRPLWKKVICKINFNRIRSYTFQRNWKRSLGETRKCIWSHGAVVKAIQGMGVSRRLVRDGF